MRDRSFRVFLNKSQKEHDVLELCRSLLFTCWQYSVKPGQTGASQHHQQSLTSYIPSLLCSNTLERWTEYWTFCGQLQQHHKCTQAVIRIDKHNSYINIKATQRVLCFCQRPDTLESVSVGAASLRKTNSSRVHTNAFSFVEQKLILLLYWLNMTWPASLQTLLNQNVGLWL